MSKPRAFHEAPLPLFAAEDEAVGDALPGKLPSYIADHRKRLRTRFMEGGATAIPDYELLELLLFRAIPRQDVKPLARELLDTFGDFNRVVTAVPARLMMVKGVGDAVVQELENRRSRSPADDARPRDEPPAAVVMGCAARLLPHRDGAPRNRTIPHPVP